jgi:hypothetical protein
MPLIKLFLDIALFSKGPQDTPSSTLLLALTVGAKLIVGIGLSAFETDWVESLLQSLVDIALLAGFLFMALSLARKIPRLLQTATTAFGCDTLISAAAVPLLIGSRLSPEAEGVASILLMFLLLWQVTVIGHILRHALSIPFMAGFGLAFVYTVVSYRIMMALFPVIA